MSRAVAAAMVDEVPPKLVSDAEVTCVGTAESPHAPRHLLLPPDRIVHCPDCRLSYLRRPGWQRITGASWPKRD